MRPQEPHEPVTVTDKRRIDPETGQVREGSGGQERSGHARSAGDDRGFSATPAAAPDTEEAAELKATLQRVKAEYDNYRKRSVRQEQLAVERAKAWVVAQLLGVLDDLDRARSHGDLEAGPLKSVADKLTDALVGLGLKGFGAEGDEFDPLVHEAVQHEGDGSNPVVGTVMRRGYRMGEQILRHALVGVVDEPLARRASDADEPLARRASDADEPLARRASDVDEPQDADTKAKDTAESEESDS